MKHRLKVYSVLNPTTDYMQLLDAVDSDPTKKISSV